jgi:hypothetical protein
MQKSSIEERFDLKKETLDRAISQKIPEYASKSLVIAYEIYGRLYPNPEKEEELNAVYIRALNDADRLEIHVNGINDSGMTYDRICGVFKLRKEKNVLSISEKHGHNLEKFAEIKLS